jgi:putative glutamine amidotransferase
LRRPLIGISSYPRTGKREEYGLPTGYVDAVRAAGGTPIIFPPGEADPEPLLDIVDGLILSGGGDISPKRYAGADHEMVYGVSEERDAFELALARVAIGRVDRPLLCICRGLQVLNVALGGDLHVHLDDHRHPERLPIKHSAHISGESQLAKALGATDVTVLSWHHQAVNRPGQNLRAVAWASDGVIEALEHESHPFCLAVQWHPEMQLDDPVQQRLFQEFVKRCLDSKARSS